MKGVRRTSFNRYAKPGKGRRSGGIWLGEGGPHAEML